MSLFTLQTSEQQQYGPVELDTLRAWAREGRIEKYNLIYDHTRLKWIEAARVPQIMEFFHASQGDKVAAPRKDPLRETDVEDPLTRAERQVAAQIQMKKSSAILPPAAVAVAKAQQQAALSNKMKLRRELMRTDESADKKSTGGLKPPTVLDRITRIFLKPFAGKKAPEAAAVPPKKVSQRIKPAT